MNAIKMLVCGLMAALVAGCNADLSGDIFVRMDSGDVKRGAGLGVIIVADTPAFQADWAKVVERYGPDLGKALQDVKDSYGDEYKTIGNERWVQRVTAWYASALVEQVVKKHRVPESSQFSDSNGHYKISLKRGRYFVFCVFGFNDAGAVWMVPVDLSSGSKVVDLTNDNAGLPAVAPQPKQQTASLPDAVAAGQRTQDVLKRTENLVVEGALRGTPVPTMPTRISPGGSKEVASVTGSVPRPWLKYGSQGLIPMDYKDVSMDFKNAEVADVLRFLSKEGGLNLVPGEDVKGRRMNATFNNVKWYQALETILEVDGLYMVEKDGIITIHSK